MIALREPSPYNPVPLPYTCPYCEHVNHSISRTFVKCQQCHIKFEIYRGQADNIIQLMKEHGPLTMNELVDLVDGTKLTVREHRNAQGRMDRLIKKAEHFGLVEQIRPSRGGKWRVRE